MWTFLITKTYEITSCSYALKSWNTLYMHGYFLTLPSEWHKLKYTKTVLHTWAASASWRFLCFLFRWQDLKPQITSFLSFLDNSTLCFQTCCYGIIHFFLKSKAMLGWNNYTRCQFSYFMLPAFLCACTCFWSATTYRDSTPIPMSNNKYSSKRVFLDTNLG